MSRFGTQAVHAGASPDTKTGAVIHPISLSTTFAQTAAATPVGGFEYSRSDNPNRSFFEEAIAALEKGKYGVAFSSGSAATASILQALAPGGHIVSISDVYGGTHRYFTQVAGAHNISISFSSKLGEDLPRLLQPNTKLVWIESPSNPTLSITDIRAIANQLKDHPAKLVVDNTFLSPFIQNPIALGADIAVHSVTKFLNGHSDVVMGVAVTSDDDIHQKLRFMQNAIGAVPSPFDCWLAHRGVKTLHLRLTQSSHNAQAIAELLEERVGKEVVSVSYPGLETNPQREIVRRQHRDGLGGGMISFRIKGGAKEASDFCAFAKIFTLAESLGGIESLCEVPAAMTHAGIPEEERAVSGVYDNLIRVSVGIEDTQDLLDDVKQALERAAAI